MILRVVYEAPCPACGELAEWTCRVVQHPNRGDSVACDVACRCPVEPVEAAA